MPHLPRQVDSCTLSPLRVSMGQDATQEKTEEGHRERRCFDFCVSIQTDCNHKAAEGSPKARQCGRLRPCGGECPCINRNKQGDLEAMSIAQSQEPPSHKGNQFYRIGYLTIKVNTAKPDVTFKTSSELSTKEFSEFAILKEHLKCIQVALGEMESWLAEPSHSLTFANQLFHKKLAAPNLKGRCKPRCFITHAASATCVHCFYPKACMALAAPLSVGSPVFATEG